MVSKLRLLASLLQNALTSLQKSQTVPELEFLLGTIHQVMSARERKYHTVDHLLDISHAAEALEVLAILFHDLVYLQVDRRIHPLLQPFIKLFNLREPFTECLLPTPPHEAIQWVYQAFQVKEGQMLDLSQGLNEFLSAIVAVELLKPVGLSRSELISVICSIEATIPFRFPRFSEGELASLFELTLDEAQTIWERSSSVANRDVANFAASDSAEFLGQTWNLILEGNPIFRNPLYTIQQYRMALQKVDAFYRFLVQHQQLIFRDSHVKALEVEHLRGRAQQNLRIGLDYLEKKLVALALLEALALLTGGDAPLVFFIGQSSCRTGDREVAEMELYLNSHLVFSASSHRHPEVHRLLKQGRAGLVHFDLRQSPLANYLYEHLEQSDWLRIREGMTIFFQSGFIPEASLTYLKLFPRPVLQAILDACVGTSLTRARQIQDLGSQLFS